MVEPIWVAMWGADGVLKGLRVIPLPWDPLVIKNILQVLRTIEFMNSWNGKPGTNSGLPVMAALTGPN
jgi:hypothetical protein